MTEAAKLLRLKLDPRRTVQAIDFVAQKWHGVTQYYVCKVMYFADREHALDWGRTITGDRYVAMDHGPVPSRIYELLKPASGEEDELLDALSDRLLFEMEGNKIHVFSKGNDDFSALSQSDLECLTAAINYCRPMSFGALRDVAHRELAWRRASSDLNRNNPPMDFGDWFEAAGIDREHGARELRDNSFYSAD